MSRRISDLEPDTAQKCRALLAAAKAQGITLVITDTYRTYAQQDKLYAQGRTTPGNIVTMAKGGESFHNFGRAFDVAFREGVKGVTWEGPWEDVGDIAEALGLVWGGRWHHPDRPHLENAGGKTLAQLRAEQPNGA